MSSFNMIIPELPAYLTSIGGEDYKGLIISLFTLSAALARPYSGKWADVLGRRPMMISGVLVCIVLGFLYPIFTTLWGFFILRFFHGFSTGFKPTGTTAYLADIVPIKNRGEALGVLGVSGSLGMALGPVIGSFIAAKFGTTVMFYASSGMAMFSLLTIINMKETLPKPQALALHHFKINRSDIFDMRVLMPAMVLIFYTFSFGTILTLAPDFSDFLEIENRGYIFSVILIFSVFMRFVSGKASDKYGRYPVLLFGSVALFSGMSIMGTALGSFQFYVGGAVFGLANGIISPTIFALAVDLALPEKRGRAMATIFISLEIGIGLGALISAWIYNNQPENFISAFLTCSVVALGSTFIIIFQLIRGRR